MKKYLIVDTWNGEMYSNSKPVIKYFKGDREALKYAEELAIKFSGQESVERIKGDCDVFPYKCEGNLDDDGTVHVMPFIDCFGIIVKPNINAFEIITSESDWLLKLDTIKRSSEDYKEEKEYYGQVHHSMSDDEDWILFTSNDLHQILITESLEFTDGGDGVTYEIWKDKYTLIEYNVPIEIKRDFKNYTEK